MTGKVSQMELVTAKGILSQDLTYTYPARFNELQEAVILGKEALEYIIRLRAFSHQHRQAHLPSEDSIIDNTRSQHTIRNILESPLGKEPGA